MIHLYTVNLAHKWKARKPIRGGSGSKQARTEREDVVRKVAKFLTWKMIIPMLVSAVWMLCSYIPLIIYWFQYGQSLLHACFPKDCFQAFLVDQNPREHVSFAAAVLPAFIMQVYIWYIFIPAMYGSCNVWYHAYLNLNCVKSESELKKSEAVRAF